MNQLILIVAMILLSKMVYGIYAYHEGKQVNKCIMIYKPMDD